MNDFLVLYCLFFKIIMKLIAFHHLNGLPRLSQPPEGLAGERTSPALGGARAVGAGIFKSSAHKLNIIFFNQTLPVSLYSQYAIPTGRTARSDQKNENSGHLDHPNDDPYEI